PFPGSGLPLITQHIQKAPPSIQKEVPEAPDAFAELLLRLMAKAPRERGPSATWVAEQLEAIARLEERAPPRPWLTLPVRGALLVLLVGAIGAALLLRPSSPPPPPPPPSPPEVAIDEPAEGQ